ncbi:hypothetical protein FE257_009702 [Aspergillus nanangensis]|uniref:Uncharacterized protein n=1 Tax=Aspergillus nanangensis TaxID=2582783 RepID=A0AAD4CJM2_ASPNN|nr:hypothetical protein FE257_009702 [Aspergillus nanangensis]
MSDNAPIWVAAHPRACSTAFERVFMTQHDTIQCIHEPFGDAFYYGPERLSDRFANDERTRQESGFSQSTYATVLERIMREASEGKRIFIKDIDYYLFPLGKQPVSIAPSLLNFHTPNGTTTTKEATKEESAKKCYPFPTAPEPSNPTVMPLALQKLFHFAFLIRDPHYSVPSYYRCTIPPLYAITKFHYDPLEAGYDELRRHFDYLRSEGVIGPKVATRPDLSPEEDEGSRTKHEICVVDADDMLNAPAEMIEAFCKSVGLEYNPGMLRWDREEDHKVADAAFEKWRGFHEDALDSDGLKARTHKKAPKSEEQFDAEWREKYGDDAAAMIRKTVDENMADYFTSTLNVSSWESNSVTSSQEKRSRQRCRHREQLEGRGLIGATERMKAVFGGLVMLEKQIEVLMVFDGRPDIDSDTQHRLAPAPTDTTAGLERSWFAIRHPTPGLSLLIVEWTVDAGLARLAFRSAFAPRVTEPFFGG